MSVRSLNLVQLIGNLTRDPEMRYTTNGSAVVTFGLATNKSWKDESGEQKELTEFHNIVAWGKLAEICQQLLAKGMKVYIQGSLTTRSWQDETSGVMRYRTEVRVDDMILLDSKGKGGVGMEEGESSENKSEDAEDKPKKSKKKAEKEPESSEETSDPLSDELPF